MTDTKTFLASFGVGVDDVFNFLLANLTDPKTILDTCSQYQITNADLAEVVSSRYDGTSASAIVEFFRRNGLDSTILDIIGVREIKQLTQFRYWEHVNYYSADGTIDITREGQGGYDLLAVGDLNSDGYRDLLFGFLTWNDDYESLSLVNQFVKSDLLIATYDPTSESYAFDLQLSKLIPPMYWSNKGFIDDFNLDGYQDLLLVGTGPDQGSPRGERPVLMLGSPNGMTDASSLLPRNDVYTHQVAVGDFNEDGKTDFFLINNPWVNAQTAELLSAALGDGYSYSPRSTLSLSTETGWQDASISNDFINPRVDGVSYAAALSCDYNADGHLDLVLSGGNFGKFAFKVLFLKGDGTGNFAEDGEANSKPFGDVSVGAALSAYDFNGDNRDEIILVSTKHNGQAVPWSGAAFNIFTQDVTTSKWHEVTGDYIETGDFSNGEPIAWVKEISFLDLDRDGDEDMLLSTMSGIDQTNSGKVMPRIFINNDGYFDAQTLTALDMSSFGSLKPVATTDGISLVGFQMDIGLKIFEANF
jgi:hypothetical protein